MNRSVIYSAEYLRGWTGISMRVAFAAVAFTVALVVPAQAHREGATEAGVGYSVSHSPPPAAVALNVEFSFSDEAGAGAMEVHIVVIDDVTGALQVDEISHSQSIRAVLPPGIYTAVATYDGKRAVQSLTVLRNVQYLAHFSWP